MPVKMNDVLPVCVKNKEELLKYVEYLDELRESGVINMFGAAPYLQKVFGITYRKDAQDILSYWMKNYTSTWEE
jgi:uncharacterized protein YjgD (DUF1641 family)